MKILSLSFTVFAHFSQHSYLKVLCSVGCVRLLGSCVVSLSACVLTHLVLLVVVQVAVVGRVAGGLVEVVVGGIHH